MIEIEIRHHRSAVSRLIGCFTSVIAQTENSSGQNWSSKLSDHHWVSDWACLWIVLHALLISHTWDTQGFVSETKSPMNFLTYIWVLSNMNSPIYEFSHVLIFSCMNFSRIWILYWRANWILPALTKAYKTGFRGASKHEGAGFVFAEPCWFWFRQSCLGVYYLAGLNAGQGWKNDEECQSIKSIESLVL